MRLREILRESLDWHHWLTAAPDSLEHYMPHANAAGIAKAQHTFLELLDNDTIEVWRAMRLRSAADLDVAPLGRYFTYRKGFAIAYDAGRGGRLYRLHARLPAPSIDWPETIDKFGSGEFEITAYDSKPISFLDVDGIDEHGLVIDADQRPDLAGRQLTTGPAV